MFHNFFTLIFFLSSPLTTFSPPCRLLWTVIQRFTFYSFIYHTVFLKQPIIKWVTSLRSTRSLEFVMRALFPAMCHHSLPTLNFLLAFKLLSTMFYYFLQILFFFSVHQPHFPRLANYSKLYNILQFIQLASL